MASEAGWELSLRNGNIWDKFDSDMLEALIKHIYSSLELASTKQLNAVCALHYNSALARSR